MFLGLGFASGGRTRLWNVLDVPAMGLQNQKQGLGNAARGVSKKAWAALKEAKGVLEPPKTKKEPPELHYFCNFPGCEYNSTASHEVEIHFLSVHGANKEEWTDCWECGSFVHVLHPCCCTYMKSCPKDKNLHWRELKKLRDATAISQQKRLEEQKMKELEDEQLKKLEEQKKKKLEEKQKKKSAKK